MSEQEFEEEVREISQRHEVLIKELEVEYLGKLSEMIVSMQSEVREFSQRHRVKEDTAIIDSAREILKGLKATSP